MTQRLTGWQMRIGSAGDSEILLAERSLPGRVATLHRQGSVYSLEVETGVEVRVNGESVSSVELGSGDLIEIDGGPALRFRVYRPGTPAHKTIAEALSDCVDCARYGTDSLLGRVAVFVGGLPRELVTQTAPWLRLTTVAAMLLLVGLVAFLGWRTLRLERRLEREALRVEGVESLLAETESHSLSPADLERLESELTAGLDEAQHRLEVLEARQGALRRVISAATRSVVFLQGSYGFIEPASGKPLRFAAVDAEGSPLVDAQGGVLVGVDGDGPLVESLYTGTAFAVGDGSLLLTNRHVAVPWAFEPGATALAARGFTPRFTRFLGYLPASKEPFEVETVLASEEADVAVLRVRGATGPMPALALAAEPPELGDEIIVLGYPTGIRALLARAGERFVRQVLASGHPDFWSIPQQLAQEGAIAPLATRGIVGQVTAAAVVYDAETTYGGSGGPVLDLDGAVVAVNAAVLPEFGGSNLGVPAGLAAAALSRAVPPVPAGEGEQPEGGS